MSSIPGTWTLHFSFGCGTSYSSVSIIFNANGTYTIPSEGNSGKWAISENLLIRDYNSAATIYAGYGSGNVIAGSMSTMSGLNGCWYMIKAGVTGLAAAPAKKGPDSSGSKAAGQGAGKKSGAKKASAKKR
jgi:hypothetical protein